jgi:hypothetical protein
MPHQDYELLVWAPNLEVLIISFKRALGDKFAPAIPPDVFRRMKQAELATITARGAPSGFWHGWDVPRAKGPTKPIFTVTGLYEVLLGPAIGAEDEDFDGCWVEYVDSLRPKSTPPELIEKSAGAESKSGQSRVLDVGSTAMSGEQIRALRTSAYRQGALMMVEDDHFHLQLPP